MALERFFCSKRSNTRFFDPLGLPSKKEITLLKARMGETYHFGWQDLDMMDFEEVGLLIDDLNLMLKREE